jgi:hypothetical protein
MGVRLSRSTMEGRGSVEQPIEQWPWLNDEIHQRG